MRTTVTLPDELVRKAKRLSRKKRVSEAIAATLADYFALKNRLALLDKLFTEPVPHDYKKIKRERQGRRWSS